MKVLQLMRDVLLGLLALLILMALMTRPASANAEYRPHTSAKALSARLPAPATDNPLRVSATSKPANINSDQYLAQLTEDPRSAIHSQVAAQANQRSSGSCNSLTSPMHCDSIPTNASSILETGFLPEPSPWFMLILGLLGIVLLRREP